MLINMISGPVTIDIIFLLYLTGGLCVMFAGIPVLLGLYEYTTSYEMDTEADILPDSSIDYWFGVVTDNEIRDSEILWSPCYNKYELEVRAIWGDDQFITPTVEPIALPDYCIEDMEFCTEDNVVYLRNPEQYFYDRRIKEDVYTSAPPSRKAA